MVRSGKRVIIAAHGNSLRGLVKYLDNVSEADIVGLNIPTGIPLVYELDDDLKPLGTITWATRKPWPAPRRPWRTRRSGRDDERCSGRRGSSRTAPTDFALFNSF